MADITHNGITLSPDSGISVQTLTVSAGEYSGREDRSAMFSAKGTGTYSDVIGRNSLVVVQKGHAFIDIPKVEMQSNDTTVIVNGSANVAVLKITATQGSIWDYLSSATIDGVSVTKQQLVTGYTIPSDKGKSTAYSIELNFTGFPKNTGASVVTYSGSVTDADGTVSETISVDHLSSEVQEVSIWFSNGQSTDPTTAAVTVNLDADGNISGGSTPYINTIPTGVSWVINTENS